MRRGVRNLRRAYRSLFALIVLVLGGWAALDALRWNELPEHIRYLDIGFGLAALIATIVWTQVEWPLGRELRLGRKGMVAMGALTAVGKLRGRRAIVTITYAFRTTDGAEIKGRCRLPRRFPAHTLSVGMPVAVLYDATKPLVNKPRLAFSQIEFGELRKRKGPA